MGRLITPIHPKIKKLGRDVWTYVTPLGTPFYMSEPEAKKYVRRTGIPLRKVKR